MRGLVSFIRLGGVAVALLLIASDVADIFGFVPYSGAVPSFGRRLIHSLPTTAAGIVLLMPYRYLARTAWFRPLALALAVLIMCTLVIAAWGVYGYVGGRKDWVIIPAVGMFVLIPTATLWALVQIRRTTGNPG